MVGLLTWEGSQALALVNQNIDGKQEINKLSQVFDSVRNARATGAGARSLVTAKDSARARPVAG